MAYFWAWLVETDRKKKKRSPRRSRRPVAGKAVTRDRRVYGCCSLPFATVMTSKSLLIFSTVILDGLAGLSGGLLSEHWLIRIRSSHNDNVPMCQVGHDFISSYFRDPFCEWHLSVHRWTSLPKRISDGIARNMLTPQQSGRSAAG